MTPEILCVLWSEVYTNYKNDDQGQVDATLTLYGKQMQSVGH